jgi:hypothetical protein
VATVEIAVASTSAYGVGSVATLFPDHRLANVIRVASEPPDGTHLKSQTLQAVEVMPPGSAAQQC